MQLAETLQIVQRNIVARQMQQAVNQHRAVTVENKAVTIGHSGLFGL